MAKNMAAPGREILEAALSGLEAQRDKLEEQISQVRVMLGSRSKVGRRMGRPSKSGLSHSSASLTFSNTRPKRVLSPEARKRIAAAQKKRWAAFRKAQI